MSVETAKMSERGQIIIPKEIRNEVDANKNTIFVVSSIDKDTIVMKKMDTDSIVKEFLRMRKKTKKMSPKRIEAEIHAYRKEKSSN
ncbi:MAG: hypothetical protein ABII01_03545 [Candidatus Woesearchaeota archaeon]